MSQYDINGLINCNIISNTEEVEDSHEISLYPNPTNDLLTIDMDLSKNITCYIYSLKGERLLSPSIGPNDKTIDVSVLPSNIYCLQIGHKIIKLIKTR